MLPATRSVGGIVKTGRRWAARRHGQRSRL